MKLLKPCIDHIPAYVNALRRGWSPDTLRPDASQEELRKIAEDAASFVAGLDDPVAKTGLFILPDGTKVPRLPSMRRWIWDNGFCGHIGLRWKPGTEDLPPTCPGHIGYTIVPWRRGEGLASKALIAILPEARTIRMRYVDITTSPENSASIRVIEKAGGTLVNRYTAESALGGHETLHFQISLTE